MAQFHKSLLFTIFLTILLLASYSTPLNRTEKGLIVPLISPTSPRSPFYKEILKANNLTSTTTTTSKTNMTLNESHFMQWVLTKSTQNHQSKTTNALSQTHALKVASYHVMEVYLADPEQLVNGIFDTGSSLVWFQGVDSKKSDGFYYNQTKSNTYKGVSCGDTDKCDDRDMNIEGCGRKDPHTPCRFSVHYEDGTSAVGVMGTDIIQFMPDWEIVHDFILGCSTDNTDHMVGIVGASYSNYSLPSQLYPHDPKFSYCISLDDTRTNLIRFGPDTVLTGQQVKMVQNHHYPYYYIDVHAIQVNGDNISIDPIIFQMSFDGKQGFIIDSGSFLTHLPDVAFTALQSKVQSILGPALKYWNLPICYPPSNSPKPKIGIQFTNTTFELEYYQAWIDLKGSNLDLQCLKVTRSSDNVGILGSAMLLNVNVGYDRNNNLLYLQQMINCQSTN